MPYSTNVLSEVVRQEREHVILDRWALQAREAEQQSLSLRRVDSHTDADAAESQKADDTIKAALKVQKEEGGYAGANLIFGPNGCCTHKKITPPKSPPKNHIYRPE